jgi:hypothetical protein
VIQRTSCLGERLSGLADGSLPDDVRDRALVHVAGCDTCREALDVERLLVDRLRALPEPAPSEALTARLLALGETGGPLPPRPGRVAGTPRQPTAVLVGLAPPARPALRTGATTRPAGRRDSRRSRRALVAAAGVLGVGVIAVAALGSALPSPGAGVVPPVDQLTVQHGVTGRENPFSDAGLVRLTTPGPSATTVPALGWAETGR